MYRSYIKMGDGKKCHKYKAEDKYSNLHIEEKLAITFFRNYLTKGQKCLMFVDIRKVGCLVWFYGISTFVGYLMGNPFLCK